MITTRLESRDRVSQHKSEKFYESKYLGAMITSDNDVTKEINNTTQKANRCYSALRSVIKSKNIIIRPIIMKID